MVSSLALWRVFPVAFSNFFALPKKWTLQSSEVVLKILPAQALLKGLKTRTRKTMLPYWEEMLLTRQVQAVLIVKDHHLSKSPKVINA